jgi:DNA-binding LacI/PurR family transcriptional regulator
MSDKRKHTRHSGTRPPSSIDVARHVGVSQSAVSRAFGTGAGISPETREKILSAARELGYTPTNLPRILQSGRSGIVAIVAGGFYNPFFTMALAAFSDMLKRAGSQIMLVEADSDCAMDEIVGELVRYRVDAVVSVLPVRSQEVADTLSTFRVPIVTLNSGINSAYIRTVSSDNHGAAIQAAMTFGVQGRHRLGYLAGPEGPPQAARQAGFFQGARRAGIDAPILGMGGTDYDSGREGARAMFSRADRPDALFCISDLVACGAIDALRYDLGLRVPEDVLVIGYDNIAMAAWSAYQLSSFDQNFPAIVEGVEAMMARDVATSTLIIPPRLVARRTSVAPS